MNAPSSTGSANVRPTAALIARTSTDPQQHTDSAVKPTTDGDPWSHLPRYVLNENVHYVTTEAEADDALAPIKDGVVGFDAEFSKRVPTKEEQILENLFKSTGGNRKSMILAWQVLEKELNDKFPVAWDNIALCTIQIARANDVWIINLNKTKAFPDELRRVLCSSNITKVGVGISNDVIHLWNDFRINIMNLVDAGLMAKLMIAHKYPDQPYGNLSLQQSVAENLGLYVGKEQRESDWKCKANKGDLDDDQKTYAATDACATLRLYEVLVPALEDKSRKLRTSIPQNWYTVDGRYGELMRKFPTATGEIVPWSVKDCYWFYGGKFQGYA